MKEYKVKLLTLLLSIVFMFAACSDKDYETDPKGGGKGTTNNENASINEWIHEEMSFRYYWNDKVPAISQLNLNDEPNDFFYNSLYRYKQDGGDRFSYIENDGEIFWARSADTAKPQNDIGFEFTAYQDINSGQITLLVTYVKKGTNAEKQGVKRGHWIHSVDGTKVDVNNFFSILYSGKSSYKLGYYDPIDQKSKELTINISSYLESPILLSQILQVGTKKVGYIVYNRFANGETDTSLEYALEMNNLLKSFEGQIDELILDLRYNGGGRVLSGNYIASAIVPNRDTAKKMVYTKRAYNKDYDAYIKKFSNYNEHVHEYFQDYVSDDKRGGTKEPIPRLNMQRIYVITSRYTASASEQIINGLRAYIPVEVIGEKTTGKNMESYPIEDDSNKDNKWVLHPLTSVSYNSKATSTADNDYSAGFPPTIGSETSEIGFIAEQVYELGDIQERLLSIAINDIMGNKIRMKRSLDRSAITYDEVKPIGASLERYRNEMIIDIPNGEN